MSCNATRPQFHHKVHADLMTLKTKEAANILRAQVSTFSYLHLWMHAAVYHGPQGAGGAGSHQAVPSRGKHSLLILIKCL